MKTDIVQTAIELLHDDQGVNQLGYFNLKQMIADLVDVKAAYRFGNIVNASDDRYRINSNDFKDTLAVYDYVMGY